MMSIEHDFRQLKKRRPLESEVQKAIMAYLKLHIKVAWVCRNNVGSMQIEGRYVKFGFKGFSDVIGQMKDGRFLAVEIKRPGKMPTQSQEIFLKMVQDNGGIGFWADDVFTVEEKLREA
jgi:hypothetical protein